MTSAGGVAEAFARQLTWFPFELGADYAELRSNGPLDIGTLRIIIAAAHRCVDGLTNFADAVEQDMRETARGQT